MRFSIIALACLVSVAIAQSECSCPGGQDGCGCGSTGIGNTACFCEALGNDNPVATQCTGSGSCGCPSGENGHCIIVCILSFYGTIKTTNR